MDLASLLPTTEKLYSVLCAFHIGSERAPKPGPHQHLVESVFVVQLIAHCAVEGKDANVDGEALSEVRICGALHRGSTWDDEVDRLLLYNGLDGRLPLFRLHRGPGQDIVFGNITAETRVAVFVGHDFRRKHPVPFAANRPGHGRGLGHFPTCHKNSKLPFWRSTTE